MKYTASTNFANTKEGAEIMTIALHEHEVQVAPVANTICTICGCLVEEVLCEVRSIRVKLTVCMFCFEVIERGIKTFGEESKEIISSSKHMI